MRIWLGIGIVVLLAIIIIPAGRHPLPRFNIHMQYLIGSLVVTQTGK
jgi:hypothetical protein